MKVINGFDVRLSKVLAYQGNKNLPSSSLEAWKGCCFSRDRKASGSLRSVATEKTEREGRAEMGCGGRGEQVLLLGSG